MTQKILADMIQLQDRLLAMAYMSKSEGMRSIQAAADDVMEDSRAIDASIRGNRSPGAALAWADAQAMLAAYSRRCIEILEAPATGRKCPGVD